MPTHVILGVHQDGGALGCSHGYGSSGRLKGKALSRVGQQGELGQQPTAGLGGAISRNNSRVVHDGTPYDRREGAPCPVTALQHMVNLLRLGYPTGPH